MKNKGKKLKILIIDADRETVSIAKFCLEKLLTIEVSTAANGAEALKEAAVTQPNLILLADDLPNSDGLTLFGELRKIPGLQTTPVIFLSANKTTFDVKKYKDAGALDVIFKPIDPLLFPTIVKGVWLTLKQDP